MQNISKSNRGFTLIEVVVVMLLLGVLSSVAIRAFVRFVRKTKASEAAVSIKTISDGATAWYNDEHAASNGDPLPRHFPNKLVPLALATSTADSTDVQPVTDPCKGASGGSAYKKSDGVWSGALWKRLNFSMSKAHYYQYRYSATSNQGVSGTSHNSPEFVIEAYADLDCDGVFAKFFIKGSLSPNGEVTRNQIIAEKCTGKDPGNAGNGTGCSPGSGLE